MASTVSNIEKVKVRDCWTYRLQLTAITAAPWTADPRAVALLARCAAEPPVAVERSKTYVLTRDEWVTYEGPIADELRAIRDEHCLVLLERANRTDRDEDYDALFAHHGSPSVEQAIDEAMAEAVRTRPGALTDLMVAICRPARLAA